MPKYISHKDCASLFSYNIHGEILPVNAPQTIAKCIKHYTQLSPEQKAVLATIDVLNLNTSNLKKQRKNFIQDAIIPETNKLNKLQIKQQIDKYEKVNEEGRLEKFSGVAAHFFQLKYDKL